MAGKGLDNFDAHDGITEQEEVDADELVRRLLAVVGGEVGDPFEVGDDLERGGDEAQVAGDRLLEGDLRGRKAENMFNIFNIFSMFVNIFNIFY